MQMHREFSLVMVNSTLGAGEAVSASARTVHYDGSSQEVHF
jgi:hypothetical protein